MGTLALCVMIAAYLFGGVMTVREWVWINSPQDLEFDDVVSIVLVILLWPFAWAYWRASR